MGLLGEIVMRTYYESQSKKTYLVRDTVNFSEDVAKLPAKSGHSSPRLADAIAAERG
jgi:hypothetical protein